MTEIDPYEAHYAGLVHVHALLHEALSQLARADAATDAALLVQRAHGAAGFVLAHHHAEDTILFPGLRRLGRGRSTDLAFLDARDREHVAIHALADRLLDHARRPHPVAGELITLGGELADALARHVAEEEAGLAPARLREMIAPDGLARIGAELEAARLQASAGAPGRDAR